ncbi:MAG: protein translocase subunit SecD [Rhodospirillaceae bacterium]|nr:protein translocase subunit SecD [Rhodospirillaceae bacterium]
MVYFPKWKIILVLAVCALGIIYALPNILPRATVQDWQQSLPSWMPTSQVNLGLDLQGGSHLLLRVQWEDVLTNRLDSIVDGLRRGLRQADIGYVELGRTDTTAGFTLRDPDRRDEALAIAEEVDDQVTASVDENGRVTVAFAEGALPDLRDNALGQSIEIIRRRIDELGTTEPIIQRQGEDRILVQVPGVDPERVRDLIGRTASMTFQLVDHETSVVDARAGRLPPGSQLLPSSEADEAGEPLRDYVVRKRVELSGDNLVDAQPTFQDGAPVVSFRFDSAGARRFADITEENVGRQFAIVLDGEVISAPVIRTPILGGAGIIEGGFTVQSATDLALLLRAGALPAALTILEERSVGPGLGADSIAAGKIAAAIGFVAVVIFMFISYGMFGLMANLALVFNLALLMAGLSILQATLTLPGIAGIVLTIGMAVDANVLIFERIREEIRQGRSPISAIDAGYSRALTTIVDSNVTTLIAAVLLFALGSGPVKGFAVTLSLGIVSSMFTAIMFTRLLVVTWLRRTRPKTIPI